jgi:hypothetical protein
MDAEPTQPENGGAMVEHKLSSELQELERGDDKKSQDMPYSDLSATGPKREAISSNGPTRRVQNIVIDIESDELTYGQARSIRLQIQRDVE